MPLIGFKLNTNVVVCADCDVFPVDAASIHVGDPEESYLCCVCRRELTQVEPVGGWKDDLGG